MFNILHIPTGHFMYFSMTKHRTTYGEPVIAEFKTKAAAGKAIEAYLVGSKPHKAGLRFREWVYVLPEDFVVMKYGDTFYLRFTPKYQQTAPIYVLDLTEQKLPVSLRFKKMAKKNPNMYHKHEFLIMETI